MGNYRLRVSIGQIAAVVELLRGGSADFLSMPLTLTYSAAYETLA